MNLHNAIDRADAIAVDRLIATTPRHLLEKKDPVTGRTPLAHCAWRRAIMGELAQRAILPRLLEAGCSPNEPDRYGNFPLVTLAGVEDMQMIGQLCAYGVDLQATSSMACGQTVLQRCADLGSDAVMGFLNEFQGVGTSAAEAARRVFRTEAPVQPRPKMAA